MRRKNWQRLDGARSVRLHWCQLDSTKLRLGRERLPNGSSNDVAQAGCKHGSGPQRRAEFIGFESPFCLDIGLERRDLIHEPQLLGILA